MKKHILFLFCLGLFFISSVGTASGQVTDAQLIFKLGANNVITNQIMLGQIGKLIGLDPQGEIPLGREGALQVQRTMQSCHDTLLQYAKERGIENELIIQKLLNGYASLVKQSTAMIDYLDNPTEEMYEKYTAIAESVWLQVERDFFGPRPEPKP